MVNLLNAQIKLSAMMIVEESNTSAKIKIVPNSSGSTKLIYEIIPRNAINVSLNRILRLNSIMTVINAVDVNISLPKESF